MVDFADAIGMKVNEIKTRYIMAQESRNILANLTLNHYSIQYIKEKRNFSIKKNSRKELLEKSGRLTFGVEGQIMT